MLPYNSLCGMWPGCSFVIGGGGGVENGTCATSRPPVHRDAIYHRAGQDHESATARLRGPLLLQVSRSMGDLSTWCLFLYQLYRLLQYCFEVQIHDLTTSTRVKDKVRDPEYQDGFQKELESLIERVKDRAQARLDRAREKAEAAARQEEEERKVVPPSPGPGHTCLQICIRVVWTG